MNFSKNNISCFSSAPFGRRILKRTVPCFSGTPTTNEALWTYTYYVNDASGNVMATYNYHRTINHYTMTLDENMIYGALRIGLRDRLKLLSTYFIPNDSLAHEGADTLHRSLGPNATNTPIT